MDVISRYFADARLGGHLQAALAALFDNMDELPADPYPVLLRALQERAAHGATVPDGVQLRNDVMALDADGLLAHPENDKSTWGPVTQLRLCDLHMVAALQPLVEAVAMGGLSEEGEYKARYFAGLGGGPLRSLIDPYWPECEVHEYHQYEGPQLETAVNLFIRNILTRCIQRVAPNAVSSSFAISATSELRPQREVSIPDIANPSASLMSELRSATVTNRAMFSQGLFRVQMNDARPPLLVTMKIVYIFTFRQNAQAPWTTYLNLAKINSVFYSSSHAKWSILSKTQRDSPLFDSEQERIDFVSALSRSVIDYDFVFTARRLLDMSEFEPLATNLLPDLQAFLWSPESRFTSFHRRLEVVYQIVERFSRTREAMLVSAAREEFSQLRDDLLESLRQARVFQAYALFDVVESVVGVIQAKGGQLAVTSQTLPKLRLLSQLCLLLARSLALLNPRRRAMIDVCEQLRERMLKTVNKRKQPALHATLSALQAPPDRGPGSEFARATPGALFVNVAAQAAANRSSSLVPSAIARESVFLQYLVDTGVVRSLVMGIATLTREVLPPDPLPTIIELIGLYGVRYRTRRDTPAVLFSKLTSVAQSYAIPSLQQTKGTKPTLTGMRPAVRSYSPVFYNLISAMHDELLRAFDQFGDFVTIASSGWTPPAFSGRASGVPVLRAHFLASGHDQAESLRVFQQFAVHIVRSLHASQTCAVISASIRSPMGTESRAMYLNEVLGEIDAFGQTCIEAAIGGQALCLAVVYSDSASSFYVPVDVQLLCYHSDSLSRRLTVAPRDRTWMAFEDFFFDLEEVRRWILVAYSTIEGLDRDAGTYRGMLLERMRQAVIENDGLQLAAAFDRFRSLVSSDADDQAMVDSFPWTPESGRPDLYEVGQATLDAMYLLSSEIGDLRSLELLGETFVDIARGIARFPELRRHIDAARFHKSLDMWSRDVALLTREDRQLIAPAAQHLLSGILRPVLSVSDATALLALPLSEFEQISAAVQVIRVMRLAISSLFLQSSERLRQLLTKLVPDLSVV